MWATSIIFIKLPKVIHTNHTLGENSANLVALLTSFFIFGETFFSRKNRSEEFLLLSRPNWHLAFLLLRWRKHPFLLGPKKNTRVRKKVDRCYKTCEGVSINVCRDQGCQMAYFQTKSPNLGKFWTVLQWKMLVHFIVIYIVYFTAIWYIL
jgi:hypothetical protein